MVHTHRKPRKDLPAFTLIADEIGSRIHKGREGERGLEVLEDLGAIEFHQKRVFWLERYQSRRIA